MDELHIGTSGYSYKHWQKRFYPEKLPTSEWLEFYATEFKSVELNVTYYRLPSEKMYLTWEGATPDNFSFALKGSRYITHIKRLNEIDKALEIFTAGTKLLGSKAKVILWQFSPNFEKNPGRLEEFLDKIKGLPYDQAFEFRHQSWFENDIYNLLTRFNASLVFADSPIYPATPIKTADFIYVRFHGGRKLYGSNYSKKELENWAKKIQELNAKRTYVYFNNDAFGFAVKNAKTLRELLSGKNETKDE